LCLATLCLAPSCLYAVGGKPTWLLSSMDGQLEALRQDIGSVKDEIAKTKQDLAAAEQARNKEEKRVLLDLLLSLNNQLLSLNNQLLSLNNQLLSLKEEKNILLRRQAPSKHVFSFYMLACPCSHHVPLYSVNDSILWVLLLHMIQKGFLPRLS